MEPNETSLLLFQLCFRKISFDFFTSSFLLPKCANFLMNYQHWLLKGMRFFQPFFRFSKFAQNYVDFYFLSLQGLTHTHKSRDDFIAPKWFLSHRPMNELGFSSERGKRRDATEVENVYQHKTRMWEASKKREKVLRHLVKGKWNYFWEVRIS